MGRHGEEAPPERATSVIRSGPRRRLGAFAAVSVAVCLALLALVLRTLLVERPPVAVEIVPPPLPALTKHLVLLVLDGLRYDYATDETKAPFLAARMQRGPSAKVLAGQITMTSAAVLSFGTGARGDFAQVVTNLSVARTRQNDLFANCRAAGLTTALVGDRTWLDAFGDDGFTEAHPDATGLALDVDNSPEMFAELDLLLSRETPPSFTVAHFLATDHFGHAFGTADPRYLAMLHRFDARLEQTLKKIRPDLTVVILSDHGATATGAHGSDIWAVRQTPLAAFGPGIRAGAKNLAFEQVDVGATLATLLGVAVPAESRGTVVTSLLDLDDVQIAQVRRAEQDRAERATRAVGATVARSGTREGALAPAAEGAVRRYDQRIAAEKESLGLSAAIGTLALLLVGLATAAFAAVGTATASVSRAARWGGALFVVATASVVLTKYVELLVPPFHNVVRAVLFVLGNAVLLLWAARRERIDGVAARFPVVFFALVPGAIAFSYPANTQPEAYVCAALLLVSALLRIGETAKAALAALLFLAIVRFGYVNEDPFPAFLAEKSGWLLAGNVIALGLWASLTPLAREEGGAERAAWLVFPLLALFGATRLPPPAGIALTLLAPLLALVAYLRGHRLGARNLTLACFLLLSRDVEVAPLLALCTLAELTPAVLDGVEREADDERGRTTRLVRFAAFALVLFGLYFLARVVIQRGLDFDRLHFGAGAFGSPDPNKIWVGVMMGFRYALVAALLHGAALARIPEAQRRLATFAFLVLWLGRGATLCTMLVIGRTSYWTAQRTISDVSPALITTVVLALFLALQRHRSEAPSAVREPALSASL